MCVFFFPDEVGAMNTSTEHPNAYGSDFDMDDDEDYNEDSREQGSYYGGHLDFGYLGGPAYETFCQKNGFFDSEGVVNNGLLKVRKR